MSSTDVSARSVKVSVPVPVADADFPIGAIPPKGFPGSAKARISLRLRTPDGIELVADPEAWGCSGHSRRHRPHLVASGSLRDAWHRATYWQRRGSSTSRPQ